MARASPRSTAEQHRQAGGSRRALSERKARVAQPPGLASSAGNPVGAVDGGRLLWITFLGEARKVISRRAVPGNQISREAHKTILRNTLRLTTCIYSISCLFTSCNVFSTLSAA